MGTKSFSRGQSGRGVALTTHPYLVMIKERVWLYLYFPLWAFTVCSRAIFNFILIFIYVYIKKIMNNFLCITA
jgi:hypothetical protein